MKRTIGILDKTIIKQIILDCIGGTYYVETVKDPSELDELPKVDCLLFYLTSDDRDWNRACLDAIWAKFDHNVTPVIAYTEFGNCSVEVAIRKWKISDVIYLPMCTAVLQSTLSNIIELFEYRNDLAAKLEEKTKKLIESNKALLDNNRFVINALGSVVEFRSIESGRHVQRVSRITSILLNSLKDSKATDLTDFQIQMISEAAALHDLGKIGIPDSILNKPGKLTSEEFEIMKLHTVYGCQILEKFNQTETEFYTYCHDIVRWHHERIDGKGYPDRLIGNDIPIWAQVVSIADVIDALTSKRVYKDAYSIDVAFEMIENGECGKFSTQLIAEMIRCKEAIIQQAILLADGSPDESNN